MQIITPTCIFTNYNICFGTFTFTFTASKLVLNNQQWYSAGCRNVAVPAPARVRRTIRTHSSSLLFILETPQVHWMGSKGWNSIRDVIRAWNCCCSYHYPFQKRTLSTFTCSCPRWILYPQSRCEPNEVRTLDRSSHVPACERTNRNRIWLQCWVNSKLQQILSQSAPW